MKLISNILVKYIRKFEEFWIHLIEIFIRFELTFEFANFFKSIINEFQTNLLSISNRFDMNIELTCLKF